MKNKRLSQLCFPPSTLLFLLFLLLHCSKTSNNWKVINSRNSALKTNHIRQILLEGDTLAWIGTFGDGLYQRSKQSWVKVDTPFQSKYVYVLQKDRDGGLWVGTANYGALYYKNNQWLQINKASGLAGNTVWHQLIQVDGTLWFSSRYRGVTKKSGDQISSYNIPEGLPDRQVTVTEQDTKGRLWIGTARGGLCSFVKDSVTSYINKKSGLSGNYIRALLCDSTLRWVGSWDGGLDYNTGEEWKHIPDIIPPVVILAYDKHRILWVCTWGHGVYYYKDNLWHNLTTENSGLPNNYVIDIRFNSHNQIFFATSGGVAIFSPKRMKDEIATLRSR